MHYLPSSLGVRFRSDSHLKTGSNFWQISGIYSSLRNTLWCLLITLSWISKRAWSDSFSSNFRCWLESTSFSYTSPELSSSVCFSCTFKFINDYEVSTPHRSTVVYQIQSYLCTVYTSTIGLVIRKSKLAIVNSNTISMDITIPGSTLKKASFNYLSMV